MVDVVLCVLEDLLLHDGDAKPDLWVRGLPAFVLLACVVLLIEEVAFDFDIEDVGRKVGAWGRWKGMGDDGGGTIREIWRGKWCRVS